MHLLPQQEGPLKRRPQPFQALSSLRSGSLRQEHTVHCTPPVGLSSHSADGHTGHCTEGPAMRFCSLTVLSLGLHGHETERMTAPNSGSCWEKIWTEHRRPWLASSKSSTTVWVFPRVASYLSVPSTNTHRAPQRTRHQPELWGQRSQPNSASMKRPFVCPQSPNSAFPF